MALQAEQLEQEFATAEQALRAAHPAEAAAAADVRSALQHLAEAADGPRVATPLYLDTIGAAVKACFGRVVTIEDHQIVDGMGAQVSHALSLAGISHRMRSLGIRGEFGQSAYVAEDLYKHHGLTAEKMVEAALEVVRK